MDNESILSMLSSSDGETVMLATEILLNNENIQDIDKEVLLKILHPENGKAASSLFRVFSNFDEAKIQCMMVLEKYEIKWERRNAKDKKVQEPERILTKPKRKTSSGCSVAKALTSLVLRLT